MSDERAALVAAFHQDEEEEDTTLFTETPESREIPVVELTKEEKYEIIM
jgi:hypothetical protein